MRRRKLIHTRITSHEKKKFEIKFRGYWCNNRVAHSMIEFILRTIASVNDEMPDSENNALTRIKVIIWRPFDIKKTVPRAVVRENIYRDRPRCLAYRFRGDIALVNPTWLPCPIPTSSPCPSIKSLVKIRGLQFKITILYFVYSQSGCKVILFIVR